MPVIGIPTERLRALLHSDIPREALLEHLGHLGCDVEGYTQLKRVRCDQCGTIVEMTESEEVPPSCDTCAADLRECATELEPLEVVRMELLAVRPDMFDPGGLARVLRGYLSLETGAPDYRIAPPALRMKIDPSVREESSYRPQIACAVVENAELDPETLKIVMKLQENLHWAIGRNRKHASIGVYDLDTITPDLTYTTEDPDAFSFSPLGMPGQRMSMREILASHPKGTAYAHLLEPLQRYPVLKDSEGRVLSMPPVINSEETRVTVDSRRLFVDVTGLGRRVVDRTLNIMTTSLLENLPGARLAGVELIGPEAGEERTTPDFTPQTMTVSPEHAARTLGIEVTAGEAVELLRRMRHDATAQKENLVEVTIPAYRNDILHEVDLLEDLAIAYGYHRITPSLVPTFTVGCERPIEVLSDRLREVLCGLGHTEVMTLILTNPDAHDHALGKEPGGDVVTVAHPVSSEQTMVRTSLLPGLLATFEHNVTHALPQHIFEVGDVTRLDPVAETRAREERRFACGIVATGVGFEDAKALAEAILRELGCEGQWRAASEMPFLPGRCADVVVGSTRAMVLGEVHPEVLERFHLQAPAILIEGDLEVMG